MSARARGGKFVGVHSPASVDDGVVGVPSGLEGIAEELDEELLVLRLVPLRVGGLGELSGALVAAQSQSSQLTLYHSQHLQ